MEDTVQPAEAYATGIASFKPIKVSNQNAEFASRTIGRTEVVSWTSIDGLKIEGLLTYPINYVPGKMYPLLIMLHGGPAARWAQFFFGSFNYQPIPVFSSQGYAILRPNIRGSTGYGADFRKANIGDWGGMDYKDVLAGVDHVVDMGVADPDRMGVLGWSYGGYMTSWIITQSNRFKAACVGAGVTNLISYAGTGLPDFLSNYLSATFWDNPNLYLSSSPMMQVKNISTPTMIQHGTNDPVVPVTQGMELYAALQKLCIPSKMQQYPAIGHGEINDPKVYMDIWKSDLEWFNTYVPP